MGDFYIGDVLTNMNFLSAAFGRTPKWQSNQCEKSKPFNDDRWRIAATSDFAEYLQEKLLFEGLRKCICCHWAARHTLRRLAPGRW